jgi:hypothetical protein
MKNLFALFLLISLNSFLQAGRIFGDCKNKKTYTVPIAIKVGSRGGVRSPMKKIFPDEISVLEMQFKGLAIKAPVVVGQRQLRNQLGAVCPFDIKTKHREERRNRRRIANNRLRPRELFPRGND